MAGSQADPRAMAQDLLRDLAREMYGIQGDAGRAGDFETADDLGELCTSLRSWHDRIGPEAQGARNGVAPTPAPTPAAPPEGGATGKSATKGSGRVASKTKPGDVSFTREGEKLLVRSGVSKKSKKPYSHRVPSELIEDLYLACMAAGKGGASFTMDDLKEDAEIKAKGHSQGYYYDVLKWFGEIGFVEGAGLRGRYRLGEGVNHNFPPGHLREEFMELVDERDPGRRSE